MMGFSVSGFPRLTWNLTELLTSTASWSKEIYSLITQSPHFVAFSYASFCSGVSYTKRSPGCEAGWICTMAWGCSQICSCFPCWKSLNVLFAVLLLLSVELPAFWNSYNQSSHSSVVTTSSGPLLFAVRKIFGIMCSAFQLALLLSIIKSLSTPSIYLYYPK